MLWLALHFPQLLIDSLAVNSVQSVATVIVASTGSQRLVHQCDALARNAGIDYGLPLNTAYALQPELRVVEYCEQQQQEILDTLAQWAMQFSSSVCAEGNQAVLVEVRRSLKLFGGLPRLLQKIVQELESMNFDFRYGLAPTPEAALLLARAGSQQMIQKQENIEAAIAKIPVDFLGLNSFTRDALQQSGIRHCDQLFKLPIASLNRRFGKEAGTYVYKLLGKLPDPKPLVQTSESFRQSLDLALETEDVEVLLFTLNRMIAALCGFLRTRDVGVELIHISLQHHRLPLTVVPVRFAEASHNRKHLLTVCRERLEQTVLPAPVTAVRLQADQITLMSYSSHDLFDRLGAGDKNIRQLLDTLHARIGQDSVYRLAFKETHQPENASMPMTDKKQQTTETWPMRPLSLLNSPVPAPPVKILSNAERIEAGWTESDDIQRDYFVAQDLQSGAFYWVYCAPGSNSDFYIHGLFS